MDNIDENFDTASHDEELDFMFNQAAFDFKDRNWRDRDFVRDLKTLYRFYKCKFKIMLREKMQKNFTNIVYLTLDCPQYTINSARQDSPIDYIIEMQKQYPYNDIRVLIPIIGLSYETRPIRKIKYNNNRAEVVIEKTALRFEFFLQNKKHEAYVYRFPKNSNNVQVYGIYCEGFSKLKEISEISKIQYLSLFMKAARTAVKSFKRLGFEPDIVHSEHIPYYLGGEFELPLPQSIKVLQIVKDFTQIEMSKPEVFWAGINLADESSISKICRDSEIKKCMSELFNLKETRRFARMRDCLEFIYQNYSTFRKYVEQGESIDENAIFNRLNSRITKLFPQLAEGELYYNQMSYTLGKADYWAVLSKTYYKEIFENPKISGKIYPLIEKMKEKSTYLSYGCDLSHYEREHGRGVYQNFNKDNFRELRRKNKVALIREFNSDRVKTNFVDPTLFKEDKPVIRGYLDSFYEAPLLFANPAAEVFANGVDILFNSILKLFELHKNIQIIICIKDGLKQNFIKTWVDFLDSNKPLKGRWVFVDGEINSPKFVSAADMFLIPRRLNITTSEHSLGMYYGCVPVVSRSGILNDSISDIFEDITKGCGFKTKKSLLTEDDNPEIFLIPLMKALTLYQNNPASWNLLIKNCLNNDYSWNFDILEKYNRVYQELIST